jgi:putative ABC transport system permease protein
MGIGMIVTGLASVILGEALTGSRRLSHLVIGALLGSVLFRLLVAVALRMGLEPNDLKLITAAFVLIALVSPVLIVKLRRKPSPGAARA